MSSKAYRATRVNDVNWEQIARGKEGLGVTLGVDVGKFDVWVVCRWADGALRASVADQEPLGDRDVGRPRPAGQGGSRAGRGSGVIGDLWRCLATGAGRRRDRSPARQWQGGP